MRLFLQYDLSGDFLKSVLCSAFESGVHGVQSWATVVDVAEGTSNDYSALKIKYDRKSHDEGTRKGRKVLGLADIAIGIERLLEGGTPKHAMRPSVDLGDDMRGRLAVAIVCNDAGHIDAPLADCIVQAAIFGDVIYG